MATATRKNFPPIPYGMADFSAIRGAERLRIAQFGAVRDTARRLGINLCVGRDLGASVRGPAAVAG